MLDNAPALSMCSWNLWVPMPEAPTLPLVCRNKKLGLLGVKHFILKVVVKNESLSSRQLVEEGAQMPHCNLFPGLLIQGSSEASALP